jgi:hypothetical protein
MGVLRDSGSTRFNLESPGEPGTPRDELLEAVRDMAAGDFEVFGEISRSSDGTIAYLARDHHDTKLVALRLARSPTGNEYLLEVAKHLDSTVPAPGTGCPRCGAPLRSWGRFCTQCGLDMWTGPAIGHAGSKEEVLEAVKQATAGKFEILGEMSRAEGAGSVYFARDIATGKIEALRLRQEQDKNYSIGLTGVLQRALASPDKPPLPPRKPPRR